MLFPIPLRSRNEKKKKPLTHSHSLLAITNQRESGRRQKSFDNVYALRPVHSPSPDTCTNPNNTQRQRFRTGDSTERQTNHQRHWTDFDFTASTVHTCKPLASTPNGQPIRLPNERERPHDAAAAAASRRLSCTGPIQFDVCATVRVVPHLPGTYSSATSAERRHLYTRHTVRAQHPVAHSLVVFFPHSFFFSLLNCCFPFILFFNPQLTFPGRCVIVARPSLQVGCFSSS